MIEESPTPFACPCSMSSAMLAKEVVSMSLCSSLASFGFVAHGDGTLCCQSTPAKMFSPHGEEGCSKGVLCPEPANPFCCIAGGGYTGTTGGACVRVRDASACATDGGPLPLREAKACPTEGGPSRLGARRCWVDEAGRGKGLRCRFGEIFGVEGFEPLGVDAGGVILGGC